MKWKLLAGIFAAVATLSLLANVYQLNHNPSVSERLYKVAKVLDGDTFVTDDNAIIRLDGIEAPEYDMCGGEESKSELEKLILDKYVVINSRVRDKSGRQVATVYLNGESVEKMMLESGWADYGSSHDDGIVEKLKETVREAREKKLGIFSSKCTQSSNPNNKQCNIKGNISTTDGTKTYHLFSCREYNQVDIQLHLGEQWFCNEKDAIEAGYSIAKNCP